MLSRIKKPTTDERKAFYYFGFDAIVSYNEIIGRIEELKEVAASNDKFVERVNEHAENIELYFDSDEMKNDDSIFEQFNKDKRRQKWQSYKKDFKGFEFSADEISSESTDIKPVEEELTKPPAGSPPWRARR